MKGKQMSDEHHDKICRSLDNLVRDQKVVRLADRDYQELQSICAEARKYADEGNFDEAHRLVAFARDFLDEESSNPGIE